MESEFSKALNKAKSILEGHKKEFMNEEEELYEERISICEECPLYVMTNVGPKCNSKLFLNPITEITYTVEMPNTTQGCGCRLNAKTRLEKQHCPVNKW